MIIKLSIAIHLIGIIMWTGSLLIATRIMALNLKNNVSDLSFWSKKIIFGWSLPGLLITLLTGLYQLIYGGISTYMTQGWFHGKLTLVLILIAITIFTAILVNSNKVTFKSAMMIHGLTGFCMIAIVLLTLLFR